MSKYAGDVTPAMLELAEQVIIESRPYQLDAARHANRSRVLGLKLAELVVAAKSKLDDEVAKLQGIARSKARIVGRRQP